MNDEYAISPPKQMVSEKKHWVTASYQTPMSSSLPHCGVKKKLMPFQAPSSVSERTRRTAMMMYGKMARKYDTLPELLMPGGVRSKFNVYHQYGKVNYTGPSLYMLKIKSLLKGCLWFAFD